MGDLGYARAELDHYPTPAWVTAAIVPHLLQTHVYGEFAKVLEPACGDGAMAEVLRYHFHSVTAHDIRDYGYTRMDATKDFLADVADNYDIIVTNPPYGDLAEHFIRRALMNTKARRGMVAMVMRNEYDCARGRVDLWEHPFALKLVLTSRPRWIAGTTGAPRHNYSWFVWDWSKDPKTTPTIVHSLAKERK